MTGEYRLAVQRGAWAAFARVVVCLEPSDAPAADFVGEDYSAGPWRSAALEAAIECLRKKNSLFHARVSIAEWNPVDTSLEAVWVAAFLATAAGLGLDDRFALATEAEGDGPRLRVIDRDRDEL